MTGVPGRQGAVEYVVTQPVRLDEVERVADPQRVHGELIGNQFTGQSNNFRKEVSLPVQRPTAVSKAIETDLQQSFRAFPAQVGEAAALNDPKDQWLVSIIDLAQVHLVLIFDFTAFGPVQRPFNGEFLFVAGGVHMRTVVQADDDIAVIGELQLDAFFRGKNELAVLPFGTENMPLSVNEPNWSDWWIRE